MKTSRKIAAIALFSLVTAMFSLSALAQATNSVPGTNGTAVTPADMTVLWNTLIVALVPVIVAGIKKIQPNIPKVTWPVGAALLGVASNWLLAKSGVLPHSSWELGALCGAAGVGLREIADQGFGTAKRLILKLSGGSPDQKPVPK